MFYNNRSEIKICKTSETKVFAYALHMEIKGGKNQELIQGNLLYKNKKYSFD